MKKERNYRRISWTFRLKIEALYNAGHSFRFIAHQTGFAPSSIHNEIQHGLYPHMGAETTKRPVRYSAQIAQDYANLQKTTKGPAAIMSMQITFPNKSPLAALRMPLSAPFAGPVNGPFPPPPSIATSNAVISPMSPIRTSRRSQSRSRQNPMSALLPVLPRANPSNAARIISTPGPPSVTGNWIASLVKLLASVNPCSPSLSAVLAFRLLFVSQTRRRKPPQRPLNVYFQNSLEVP